MKRFLKGLGAGGLLLMGAAVLSTQPAMAQLTPGFKLNEDAKTLSPEEKEARRRQEDERRAQMRRIPDAPPADPWGGVRGEARSAPVRKSEPPPKSVDWNALTTK